MTSSFKTKKTPCSCATDLTKCFLLINKCTNSLKLENVSSSSLSVYEGSSVWWENVLFVKPITERHHCQTCCFSSIFDTRRHWSSLNAWSFLSHQTLIHNFYEHFFNWGKKWELELGAGLLYRWNVIFFSFFVCLKWYDSKQYFKCVDVCSVLCQCDLQLMQGNGNKKSLKKVF